MRWFTLSNDGISYFNAPSSQVPKGTIPFAPGDIEIEEAREFELKPKSRKYCFKIIVKSKAKDYIIDAQTEAEMHSWIKAVKDIVSKLAKPST